MQERLDNFALFLALASTCGAVVTLAMGPLRWPVPSWLVTEGFLLVTVACVVRVLLLRNRS
jgi:hypothetical protein